MRQQSEETPLQTNAMHLTPRVRPLLPVFPAKSRTYAYHRHRPCAGVTRFRLDPCTFATARHVINEDDHARGFQSCVRHRGGSDDGVGERRLCPREA